MNSSNVTWPSTGGGASGGLPKLAQDGRTLADDNLIQHANHCDNAADAGVAWRSCIMHAAT
jgi:hypothetical protein